MFQSLNCSKFIVRGQRGMAAAVVNWGQILKALSALGVYSVVSHLRVFKQENDKNRFAF